MAELHRAWDAGHGRRKYAGRGIIRKESLKWFLERMGFQRETTIICY